VSAIRGFFIRADISNADFSGADLRFASFVEAKCSPDWAGVSYCTEPPDFNGADLTGATFAYGPGIGASDALMSEAVFTGSGSDWAVGSDVRGSVGFECRACRGSDLRNAVVLVGGPQEADMTDSNLDGAMIVGPFWNGFVIRNSSFRGAVLTRPVFRFAEIVEADFSNALFAGTGQRTPTYEPPTEIWRSRIENSIFDGVHLGESRISDSEIIGSSFLGGSVSGWIGRMQIRSSAFEGFDFGGSTIEDSSLEGSDLEGALVGSVHWSSVRCSDGTRSNDNLGTCEGHLSP